MLSLVTLLWVVAVALLWVGLVAGVWALVSASADRPPEVSKAPSKE
ncbi:hypothetical protein M0R88_09505 [Halorussus gelatinilyticus]|uniref:Uncharacterized protein n=1 Tax=Halorussus gelatinilyticus TaxID=2937524 RepID=A0A8U0ICJ8_9EURY|nr:hypothetical protein [Halorussus gelatinilyticus]UPV98769.1 hypothetical protein M0R88_09505 [Halorussus gelatinilyticus]